MSPINRKYYRVLLVVWAYGTQAHNVQGGWALHTSINEHTEPITGTHMPLSLPGLIKSERILYTLHFQLYINKTVCRYPFLVSL